MMTKLNLAVKAFRGHMVQEGKLDIQVRLEYDMAFQTNNNRGTVWNQEDFKALYPRVDSWDDHYGVHCGATKQCNTVCHNGEAFKYIVVKRAHLDPYIDEHAHDDSREETGNQLVDEINFWQKYANTEYGDLFCPMLKAFTSKSDHVAPCSDTAFENVIIISQRAMYTGDAEEMCDLAESLNDEEGYYGDDSETRYEKLEEFSDMMGWRDVLYNPGNSGVIFDYAANCYKAVFIDYAL